MAVSTSLSRRHVEPERMDDPELDPASLRRALRALSRVHGLSGTGIRLRRTLTRCASSLPRDRPLRMLDVACGGGDAALDAAIWARRRSRRLEVVAVDRSTTALDVVRERAARLGVSVTCIEADACAELPEGPFDLAFSSLFLHHLQRDEAVSVLARCGATARHVVMEDLRRSRAGLLLAHVTLRLVSRSPVAWHDGPASVRAGWTRDELASLAAEAGLEGSRVRWAWPERWVLEASAGSPSTAESEGGE